MLPAPREKKDAIHSLDCMQQLRETSCITEMSLVGWYLKVNSAQPNPSFPDPKHSTIPSAKVNMKNGISILTLRRTQE